MAKFIPQSEDDLYEFKETFALKMKSKPKSKTGHQGNIVGLATHLAKKHGSDPSFFTKCMADDDLQDYDHDTRAAICARAHKIAIGRWPGEDKKVEAKEFREIFKEYMTKKKQKGTIVR